MELSLWKLHRYRMFALICIGNIICYMVRFSISVAILDMTVPQNSSAPISSNSSCPLPNSSFTTSDKLLANKPPSNYLNWTTAQVAQAEVSFFYGYAAGVGPMGVFADLIGARYIIGFWVLEANFRFELI